MPYLNWLTIYKITQTEHAIKSTIDIYSLNINKNTFNTNCKTNFTFSISGTHGEVRTTPEMSSFI